MHHARKNLCYTLIAFHGSLLSSIITQAAPSHAAMLIKMRPLCSLVSLRAFLSLQTQGSSARCPAASWRQTWRRGSTGGVHHPPGIPRSRAASSAAEDGVLAETNTFQDVLPQRPHTPLCERSPEHSAELGRLLAWREEALQAISAVGDAWVQQDDGPSQADLEVRRESAEV